MLVLSCKLDSLTSRNSGELAKKREKETQNKQIDKVKGWGRIKSDNAEHSAPYEPQLPYIYMNFFFFSISGRLILKERTSETKVCACSYTRVHVKIKMKHSMN